MTAPHACLAILNYDGREMLAGALPSITAQDYHSYEVVVVDNGSSDGSVDYLRREWPAVRVVELASNRGVTAALNAMLDAAAGSELVALLNNDLELEPDWLALLAGVLDDHPRSAAATGKLLRFSERSVIDRAGDELHWSSAAYGRGAGEADQGQYEAAGEVFSVGGAAALYRIAAFDRVGRFDEDFFAYLEDVDWGFRARLAGYEARYEPAAVGYHHGGATLGAVNPFSLFHLRRNQIWLVVKNYPTGALLRHLPAVLWFTALQTAYAVRPGHVSLVLRAYAAGMRGLPRMVRKRRMIQCARAIEPAALDAFMGHLDVPR